MTEAFTFRVNGTPRPQPRPRFVNGRAVSTASSKAKLWRDEVERRCSASRWYAPHFEGALHVTMQFTFGHPPVSKVAGQAHTQRPDADNLAKLVMDVMERSKLIGNDCTVSDLSITKVWGHRPGVAVLIESAHAPQRASALPGSGAPPAWLTRS